MDAREECLLTVHVRECEWTLGGGPLERNVCPLYIHYCESSKSLYIFTTTSFQEGPHQNCSFIYKKVKMKGGLGWMKK